MSVKFAFLLALFGVKLSHFVRVLVFVLFEKWVLSLFFPFSLSHLGFGVLSFVQGSAFLFIFFNFYDISSFGGFERWNLEFVVFVLLHKVNPRKILVNLV